MQLNLCADLDGYVYFDELFYILLKRAFAKNLKKKITPQGLE